MFYRVLNTSMLYIIRSYIFEVIYNFSWFCRDESSILLFSELHDYATEDVLLKRCMVTKFCHLVDIQVINIEDFHEK